MPEQSSLGENAPQRFPVTLAEVQQRRAHRPSVVPQHVERCLVARDAEAEGPRADWNPLSAPALAGWKPVRAASLRRAQGRQVAMFPGMGPGIRASAVRFWIDKAR